MAAPKLDSKFLQKVKREGYLADLSFLPFPGSFQFQQNIDLCFKFFKIILGLFVPTAESSLSSICTELV